MIKKNNEIESLLHSSAWELVKKEIKHKRDSLVNLLIDTSETITIEKVRFIGGQVKTLDRIIGDGRNVKSLIEELSDKVL